MRFLKPEIKQKWVAKLRDQETTQVRGRLRDTYGCCVLGALCDVSKMGYWKKAHAVTDIWKNLAFSYTLSHGRTGESTFPPHTVLNSVSNFENAAQCEIRNIPENIGFDKTSFVERIINLVPSLNLETEEVLAEPVWVCLSVCNDEEVSFDVLADIIEEYL